jgi:hypothetical protein
MAKKVVATLKDKTKKGLTKVIRAVKTEKGTYAFKSEMVLDDNVQAFLKEKTGK